MHFMILVCLVFGLLPSASHTAVSPQCLTPLRSIYLECAMATNMPCVREVKMYCPLTSSLDPV